MARASVALVLFLFLGAPPSPARAQQPDTVRVGELIRVVVPLSAVPKTSFFGERIRPEAPPVGTRTGRFLDVDSASVLLADHPGGAERRIDPAIQRVEVVQGIDHGRGFRQGALIGALLGGALAGVAAALLESCGECEYDVFAGTLTLAAVVVAPAALVGGILGYGAAPSRWQVAVLPPPTTAESYLAAPDLTGLSVWGFAGSAAQAALVEQLRRRQQAAGVRPLELSVQVDGTRSGPAEVSYFDPADAAQAAALAFWLRKTLDQPQLGVRRRDRPGNVHYLEVWLGR